MLKKLIIPICALMLSSSYAGFATDAHPAQGYPEVKGNVVSKTAYTAKGINHMLILSLSDLYNTRDETGEMIFTNREIYAYDYSNDGAIPPTLDYKMYDYVHQCETFARLEFSNDIPLITDLDNDGQKEVWIAYYQGCHGDVSPDTLKVFMYENGKKHAIRGHTSVFVDGMFYGGDYKVDAAMQKTPKPIYNFALSLFNRCAHNSPK